MGTRFTSQGLMHEHSDQCSHSLFTQSEHWMDVPPSVVIEDGGRPQPHEWRRIEYRDDVVPWHCMNCGTYDTGLWDEPCPMTPPTVRDRLS